MVHRRLVGIIYQWASSRLFIPTLIYSYLAWTILPLTMSISYKFTELQWQLVWHLVGKPIHGQIWTTRNRQRPSKPLIWRRFKENIFMVCNHPRCLTWPFLQEGQTNYIFTATNEQRKIIDPLSCKSKKLIYLMQQM